VKKFFLKNKSNKFACFLSVTGVFLILTTVLFCPTYSTAEETVLQDSEDYPEYLLTQIQDDASVYEANTVYMGVWLINIYDYQYIAGDYTFDFYLFFLWVDNSPNMTKVDWEIVNGYLVNPTTLAEVDRNLTGPVKHDIYRVTARLSTPPDAIDYPFEPIYMGINFDFITHGYYQKVVWLANQTGIDSAFKNPGWVTTNVALTSTLHSYPLDVELPRAAITLTQQRQRIILSIQSFIPPLIFAIVSAFSFLFGLREQNAVALRIGLNTSMLVTTLLYNFAVENSIPPSSTITIYGIFILSVLIFMVLNLLVTILGVFSWLKNKHEKHTQRINQWGLLLTFGVPVLFFFLMYFLRG
jgi:hypothetical protein